VAQAYPHDDGSIKVAGVKVYVVVHNILTPDKMINPELKPDDPWTYMPYYAGDFKEDGELKDADDPLLYWLIPRFRWPEGEPLNAQDVPPDYLYRPGVKYRLVDFLEAHGQMKTEQRGPNR
jgi:hypothetical protein